MPRLFCVLLAVGVVWGVAGPVQAQQSPPKPSVTGALYSTEELYADLKFILVDLAKEQKPYDTLKETLDVFVEGIDTKEPLVAELIPQKSGFGTVLQLPVSNFTNFLANIKALGVKTKKRPPPASKFTFACTGAYTGFLRQLQGQVTFAEDAAVVDGPPAPKVKSLAKPVLQLNGDERKFDVGAVIDNSAEGLKDRTASMDNVEKQAISALKPLKNESKDAFALRELASKQQFAEIKRFYVESKHIAMGWKTDVEKREGHGNILLIALPETSLAKSVELVGKEPSYFAGYKVNKESPLSGIVNFPIDEMRQKNFQEFTEKSRPVAKERIDNDKNLSDQQKTHAHEIADLFYDITEQVSKDGVFDGFIDVRGEKMGAYTVVGGIKVKGDIVADKLKNFKGDHEIKTGVDKVGDVDIHTVGIPADREELHDLFGKDATIYVGTSADAVWYAIGVNAMDALKDAIGKYHGGSGDGEKSAIALAFHFQASPWAEAIDKHLTRKKLGNAEERKNAIDAFKGGKDTMDMVIERVDQEIRVQTQVYEGMLRFAGKVIAEGVKNNLE
ncbi:MAG TPA: hypothetical protein VHB77_20680 [Planctomycetaceae bacterium]|nr:hypothetical protein [Planctomycetaceae bacterium]